MCGLLLGVLAHPTPKPRPVRRSIRRLPGLHSEMVSLHALTGELDEFGFEDYLGDPRVSEVAPPDLHATMEARFRLGTAAPKRAMP